jgi:hypothetical protein
VGTDECDGSLTHCRREHRVAVASLCRVGSGTGSDEGLVALGLFVTAYTSTGLAHWVLVDALGLNGDGVERQE